MIHEYSARLERVKDGDTFVLLIDLGFGCYAMPSIRVLDYNAPELGTPEGEEAKTAAIRIFSKTKDVKVRTYKDARTFERWLAEVWVDGIKWSVAMGAKGWPSRGLTPLDRILKKGGLLQDDHVMEGTGNVDGDS